MRLLEHIKWLTASHNEDEVIPMTFEAHEAMKEKPCHNHTLAVKDLNTAEVRKLRKFMTKCKRCGWFIKMGDHHA